jgi:hypothetical protein
VTSTLILIEPNANPYFAITKLILEKNIKKPTRFKMKKPAKFTFLNLISITRKLLFLLFCESSSDPENVWDYVEKIFVSQGPG